MVAHLKTEKCKGGTMSSDGKVLICSYCGKSCETEKTYGTHLKSCTRRNTEAEERISKVEDFNLKLEKITEMFTAQIAALNLKVQMLEEKLNSGGISVATKSTSDGPGCMAINDWTSFNFSKADQVQSDYLLGETSSGPRVIFSVKKKGEKMGGYLDVEENSLVSDFGIVHNFKNYKGILYVHKPKSCCGKPQCIDDEHEYDEDNGKCIKCSNENEMSLKDWLG